MDFADPTSLFWSAWENDELFGCGARKELDARHGEIKAMRTARGHLRKGVASAMLHRILREAQRRGYRRVRLETGTQAKSAPARQLLHAQRFQGMRPVRELHRRPKQRFYDDGVAIVASTLASQARSLELLEYFAHSPAHTFGDARHDSGAAIAAIALAFHYFLRRFVATIRREGAADVYFRFKLALLVPADVTTIAFVRLDQRALAGFARGLPRRFFTGTLRAPSRLAALGGRRFLRGAFALLTRFGAAGFFGSHTTDSSCAVGFADLYG